MTRILILGLNFSPELTGIGKYTGDMAAFLAERDHEVHAVTTPPYYPQWRIGSGYRGTLYRRESFSGVRVTRCPIWVPASPSGMKRAVHLGTFAMSSTPVMLLEAARKPQVVVAIAPAIASAPAAWLASKMAGSRSWLHIQDFELDTAANLDMLPLPNLTGRILELAERWVLRRFDRVSSISRAMVERAATKGVPTDRLELLPNWVDTERICPNGRDRTPFRIPSGTFVAMYSGNLGKKQGLESLLDVARQLQTDPDIQLVICGEGSMREEIAQRAASQQNVQLLPLQPESSLNSLLNAADVHLLPELPGASDLVLPSKLGGMLASGKPVVASARAGSEIERIVGDAGIIVPPGDVPAMADAIRRLAGDPELRAQMGQLGRRYAETHLSRQAILGQFAAKLEALAEA